MSCVEAAEPWHEPANGECRRDVDVQLSGWRLRHSSAGELQLIERLAYIASQTRTFCGQVSLASALFKQGRAEPGFQRTNLMSDGRRRHAQFIRGLRERTCPRQDFERAQTT
jgi:hypothetical protein